MSASNEQRAEPCRWPASPVLVDYYTIQPSADRWLVVATVRDDASHSPAHRLVVGVAGSRDAAIGDMVRRLTRIISPAAD